MVDADREQDLLARVDVARDRPVGLVELDVPIPLHRSRDARGQRDVLREGEADARVPVGAVLQHLVVVVQPAEVEAGPPVADPGFGPPAVRHVVAILDGVDPADETELTGEFRRHPGGHGAPGEIAGVLPDGAFHGPAALVDPVFVLVRLVKPVADIPCAAERQRRVERHQPAVVFHELAIGEQRRRRAHCGRASYLTRAITFCAFFPNAASNDAVGSSRRFIVGEQQADRCPVADLAAQLGAVSRIHDAAGLDRARHADEVEDFLAFEKERAQLRDTAAESAD